MRYVRVARAIAVALLFAACEETASPNSPSTLGSGGLPTANLAARGNTLSGNTVLSNDLAAAIRGKVQLCHRNEGEPSFILIGVAEAAVAAHRAHGDAAVGEQVPDAPSMVFDDSCTPVQAPLEDCYPNLPAPQLALETITVQSIGGVDYDHYDLDVLNRSSFPDALFAPAPSLPPCGSNTSSSRTWVEILGGDGTRIYGFCGLQAAEDLNAIWFALPHGQSPPPQVFIVLTDRQCGIGYESNRISIP